MNKNSYYNWDVKSGDYIADNSEYDKLLPEKQEKRETGTPLRMAWRSVPLAPPVPENSVVRRLELTFCNMKLSPHFERFAGFFYLS
ncbi:hypothetical protein MASR1M107_16610 [Ignavibacteriales bacterium]